jgi:hypothetical protein
MKRLLLLSLPVVFRTVSKTLHFALPTRKHYQVATDYDSVPSAHGLNPVPSFANLPSQAILTSALPPAVRLQTRAKQASCESFSSVASSASQLSIDNAKPPPERTRANDKHYDVTGMQLRPDPGAVSSLI